MVSRKQCLEAVLALGLSICLAFTASAGLAQETPGSEPDPGTEETDPGAGEESLTAGSQTGNDVTADWKGMIGMGLIGAELGFVLPAVAGMKAWWGYLVFPIVGAAAGGAGGYFLLESGDGKPELAVATLAVGMALVIPATVLTLSLTAYDPEDEATVLTDEEVGLQRPIARRKTAVERARAAGPGLVRWSGRDLLLAAPAVAPVTEVPPPEARGMGSRPVTMLRVPVVSGSF